MAVFGFIIFPLVVWWCVLASPAYAMAPPEDQRVEGSDFLGAGALSCRALGHDPGRQPAFEIEQWVLGYLSAIDSDMFSMKNLPQDQRIKAERQVVDKVMIFLKGFCFDFPQAGLGDGLRVLRSVHHAARWDEMIEEIYNRWDIDPK